jgi:opacity protein-like surface antigen
MPRSTSISIVLAAALLALPAGAQDAADYDYDNLVLTGVGAHVGLVFPSRSEATLGFNVRADLGLLGPNLRIAPGLSYWQSSFRLGEVDRIEERIEASCERGGRPCTGIDLGTIRVSDLSLDLDAHYLWTTALGIEPYAGAGVSLHLQNGSGEFIDETFVEELLDQIAPGMNLVAGVEMPLAGNLRVLGEARGVLTGNLRSFSVGVGGSWAFPSDMRRPVMPPPATPPTSTTTIR